MNNRRSTSEIAYIIHLRLFFLIVFLVDYSRDDLKNRLVINFSISRIKCRTLGQQNIPVQTFSTLIKYNDSCATIIQKCSIKTMRCPWRAVNFSTQRYFNQRLLVRQNMQRVKLIVWFMKFYLLHTIILSILTCWWYVFLYFWIFLYPNLHIYLFLKIKI